jgi:large subunit ribosomal protein L31
VGGSAGEVLRFASCHVMKGPPARAFRSSGGRLCGSGGQLGAKHPIIQGFPLSESAGHGAHVASDDSGSAGNSETEDTMKDGIHPNYREVCFVDLSNGFKFVTRSCATSKETIKMEDGKELPLFKLETTSETHPFYTGTQKSIDSLGGRVEKFRNKFARVGLKKSSTATGDAAAAE